MRGKVIIARVKAVLANGKPNPSKLVKLSNQLDLILLNVDSLADAHHLLPQGDHLGQDLTMILSNIRLWYSFQHQKAQTLP